MSKEKNLEVDALETVGNTAEATKEKKVKEPQTAEQIAAVTEACEKVKAFGVTDNFARVMKMVPLWPDTDENKAIKDSVIEEFGGSDKLKDYVDGEFKAELDVIAGLGTVFSRLNNIKSFYARRDTLSKPKVKYTTVSIGGEYYQVNSEYMASLQGTDNAEKRDLLLAHADTKKNETIEVL